MTEILKKIGWLSGQVKTFAMFELKEALSVLEILDRETCFDNTDCSLSSESAEK